jgi:methylenetetrahydrofolate dehydrogenase (NADP+)/methenyltetrahydrofolate cyclohydrolase
MKLIDGNALSADILSELKGQIAGFARAPHLALVRVGEDPASRVYVGKKEKIAASIGLASSLHIFPESITEEALLAVIDELNADSRVNGILVQAPLPGQIDSNRVFNRVRVDKDVDGFSRENLGRLVQEDPEGFVACTPAGIVEMIDRLQIPTSGRHAVVVGRSLIVGKPAGLLFLRKGLPGDCTVTFCHSKTPDLAEHCRRADILIAAIGRAGVIRGDMIKPGAVVIDVGINRVEDASAPRGYRIVGDVAFAEASQVAGWITPVPGGVGPLTVAMLMKNTIKAFCQQTGTPS